MKRPMTREEKFAFAKAMTFACIFLFLLFYGIDKLMDHDRNKMLAFIAKCEAGGNHAVMRTVDSGACYAGPAPVLVERYNYEFK